MPWVTSREAGPGYGEMIRQARESKGWSQRTLAKAASLSTALISRLEAGDGDPSAETAVTLAEALGLAHPQRRCSCCGGSGLVANPSATEVIAVALDDQALALLRFIGEERP